MNERGKGGGSIGRVRILRRYAWAVATWALLLAVTPASAQPQPTAATATETDAEAAASESAPADLVIANREIVTLRAPVLGGSPADRVAAIEERIDVLLDRGGATPVASMTPVDGGFLIRFDGEPVFRVLDADVAPDTNQTTEQLAAQTIARFNQALGEIQEGRNARALLPAAGWSLLATLVLVLLVWALMRAHRWTAAHVRASLERRAARYGAGWRGHLFGVANPAALLTAPLRFALWLVALFFIYTWAGFVLRQFPYTRPWGEALRSNLLAALGDFGNSALRAIPGLLFVLLIFVVARLAVRIVRAFFEAVYQGRVPLGWVDQATARPTGRIVSWAIWLFALVAAYPYIPGSDF
jgi:hypothetical protein